MGHPQLLALPQGWAITATRCTPTRAPPWTTGAGSTATTSRRSAPPRTATVTTRKSPRVLVDATEFYTEMQSFLYVAE